MCVGGRGHRVTVDTYNGGLKDKGESMSHQLPCKNSYAAEQMQF